MSKFTVGLVQMSCTSDSKTNLEKAVGNIKKAAKKGAQVVALQELFTAPYFCQKEKNPEAKNFAEKIPGTTTKILQQAGKDNKVIVVSGSIYEKADGKFYNTSLIINDDGKILTKYRKMHIPQDPRYYEQNYFEPGDLGYPVATTRYGKIAVLICYDQWFPEAARIMALNGAEIVFYPTAIGRFTDEKPFEGDWQKAWEDVQRGHAISNNIYIAPVNRVGVENKLNFWGGSFVSDPFGNVIAHAGNKEEILLAEIDTDHAQHIHDDWGFFRNRRPETYNTITANNL